MTQKTLSLLLLADDALLADAILAQLTPESGFVARSLPFSGLSEGNETDFSGLDLILVLNAANRLDEIAELLRSNFYRGPVLYLGEVADHSGRPDIVPLPVSYAVLVQKLRSLAQSFWFRDDLVITIGPMMLRPAFKDLYSEGRAPIALTDKEVEILLYLYRAGGKIVLRDVLLAEIWGYNPEVSTHTLETHIYRLRQKIEAEPDFSGILMTEAGGYRLASAVGE